MKLPVQVYCSLKLITLACIAIVLVVISVHPTHAQTTHAQTCGSFGTVTGFRPSGLVNPGTYQFSWDSVKSVTGGSIGLPVTGKVWYHVEVNDLNTSANPDLTFETPQPNPEYSSSNPPPARITYGSYAFVSGHTYKVGIWARGGCGYGPGAIYNISTPVPTAVPPTRIPPTATPIPPTLTPIPPTNTVIPTPTTAPSCPIVPVDVVLMLDRSSSMWKNSSTGGGTTKNNLEWAKDAAKKFVDAFKVTQPGQVGKVRVGVGSFASSATSTTPVAINTGYSSIISAINAIPTNSTGTCIECGLYAANIKLQSAGLNNGDRTTKKIVVLLSDGRANTIRSGGASHDTASQKAVDEATRGKTGTYGYAMTYFVNGFGKRVSYSDGGLDEPLLQKIANGTGTPYYRYEQDAFDWDNIFKSFQNSICTMSAFRASVGIPNQDVAGAETERITIDKATLKAKIEAFVDALFREYHAAK